ncbi:hypothetical protein J437_LFUL014758 [Ladona fulva]|uniref:GH18 domain-containing protein n=1 Tax=Ladona fulva TaxID=123851 RepID=A0A8K0KHT8_LADFU|nr:hypothetical protein J437_LFUL014758 [Ladona fulva]
MHARAARIILPISSQLYESEMKTIIAVAIAHLILLVAGSDVPGEHKRVTCYYMGVTIGTYSTLYPEDLDASICTHLVYLHGAINEETEEISLKSITPELKTGGEGFIPRLAKLKEVNPDLKLILHVADPDYNWISQKSSRKSQIIQSGIKWLNESGFDGLDMPMYWSPAEKEGVADLFCEIKSEFDKHGYILTAIFMENSFPEPPEANVDIVSKMARCCDHVALRATTTSYVTHRLAPLSLMKSNVNKYMERGLPANKTLIIVPAVGIIFTLEDPRDTGLGANVSGPGFNTSDDDSGPLIRYKELQRIMNDSSLGWTIRRDNETMEPYAFSTTGLWTSYEDGISMEFKARYVMERGLAGIAINLLETEDTGNTGEEGRFPLTRAIHNTFSRGLQSADTTP